MPKRNFVVYTSDEESIEEEKPSMSSHSYDRQGNAILFLDLSLHNETLT